MTPPSDTDLPAAAARRLRRAIRGALLRRAAWGALVFGLLLAGGAFFALRVAAPPLSPLSLLPWTAIPVAALFLAAAVPALRRLPSRERCLAAVESASRAGGLALCSEMPGAAAWAVPETLAPAVRFRPSPALFAALPLAAAFWALSLALPRSLFEKVLPPPPDPTGVRALAAREESRLEDLAGAGALDEAEASELRAWLEQVREGAGSGDVSQASLLEALDHVARKLDDAALSAASAAVAEQNALLAAEGVASALANAAAAGELAPESAAAAPAALSGMLRAMPLSPASLASVSATLPPGSSPPGGAGGRLPPEMMRRLAEILSQVSTATLATLAEKLSKGGGAPSAEDAPELSPRDLLALREMLEDLTPEALYDLASFLSKLSPENLEKFLGGGASGSGGPAELMTPEEYRRFLAALHDAWSLSSNRLERLLQCGGPGCSQCKRALLPGAGAALDALLQRARAGDSAAAAAAAACLGLRPGTGTDGDGGPPSPLGFAGSAPPAGPESFRDVRLRGAGGAPDSSVLVGVSAGDPDAAPAAAPAASGALDPSASSPGDAGATRAAPVLPRHRKAVESYFGDEPRTDETR